jgi:hypothetical protein
MRTLTQRVDRLEWRALEDGLDDVGVALTGQLLNERECR